MNKKQFLIATVAALLSVSSVSAATDITGITGNNGIFNIDPSHVNGDVGYRQYDKFNLSQGDIANLIFKYGNSRDIETFINLVNNGVKTQIPVRGQEFVLFPNFLPEKESNINSECIENYNKFIEKIKEVIKKQAAKFLIS